MKRLTKPLVLLDRDGTLIEERDYLSDPAGVKLLPGAARGLKRLKRAGFRLVVVSNQSGVGRGLMTMGQLKRVNRRFLQLLKVKKVALDGVYWCPHRPSARCSCRKPKLGMAKRAAKGLGVPWKGSISVGDRPSDVQLGQKTGGRGILVLTGYGRQWSKKWKGRPADYIAKDFRQAAVWILKMTTTRSGYGN
jgi:D-glycero-D-manno-heptose 1,7-bisphosphate phosphatase